MSSTGLEGVLPAVQGGSWFQEPVSELRFVLVIGPLGGGSPSAPTETVRGPVRLTRGGPALALPSVWPPSSTCHFPHSGRRSPLSCHSQAWAALYPGTDLKLIALGVKTGS